MKGINKEKRRQYLWVIVLVGICSMLILGVWRRYVISLRSGLRDQTISHVLTVTQQQQQAFDSFISGDRERLHSFAIYFSLLDSKDEEGIRERLSAFHEVDANYTVINLETGAFYNNRTDNTYQMDSEELAVYRTLSGASVRNPYKSLYSADMVFGYYECFTFADGAVGMIQKSYDCSKVSDEFSLSFYNGQGLGYVVTREGLILMRSVDKNGEYSFDNIFDMVARGNNAQEDVDDFVEALEHQETGTVIFHEEEGDYIYSYVPVRNAKGWYLISIVPVDAVMQEAEGIIQSSQTTIVFLMIVLLIFSAFLFLILRSYKKIKEREHEIEYRKQQFEIFSAYLSSNTDDVYMMLSSKDYRAEYVSPNVERVMGIPEEEIRENVSALGCAKYVSGKEIGIQDLDKMNPGDSLNSLLSERIQQKTGEHKWFRESIYCVSLQGERKIIVYFSDRTKERVIQDTLTQALDMAQVANKAKSAFLGNVSHDIRTPMNAIMGLVTLLQQEADNPERVLEYTQRINVASQHLLSLINDVLDMNKIEGGGITLNITEVNMAEMIDELNVIIRPQTRAKNQTFKIFASSFVHEHLMGDKLRLNQILINILSNAVKYTPEGGRVELHVNELPGVMEKYNHIQFIIRDNGRGMSEEYQKVIFDPFTREQNAAANEVQGTGLGMAITKSLVDLMGGTIQVESSLGEGSTFTLELDLHIREEEDDPEFWKENAVRRMIVADDDEDICRNVVKAMENTGVEVHYSTSGQKAVEMMRTAREGGNPYDLILLDWKMPDLNGLETARLIRERYSEQFPILLFTAYDWSEIEHEAAEVGIHHFLPKPFFMHSFKEAIRRIMNKNAGILPENEEESVVAGRHILVVDDIEVNRMILVKILDTLGAVCDIAVNGQEAVDKFTGSQPGDYDLILMDVQMPILNGYEATKAIRGSGHPCADSIAIIAMTANAFVDDVRDALASGMDAHVSKPIVLDQLKAVLREVLERKEQER